MIGGLIMCAQNVLIMCCMLHEQLETIDFFYIDYESMKNY